MAGILKILSPEKEVVLSHPDAGCPMAEQINPKEVEAYRKAHPDHGICAYVNTTAELKALGGCLRHLVLRSYICEKASLSGHLIPA